jgi:lysophospholipase L1-like esterase
VDNALSGGSVALYCQDNAAFDNVVITANPLQPLVVLSTPLAYSVASTRDEGDTLTAEAIVLNKPEGASVWFALDDGPETAALEVGGNIYLADFEGVPDGDYDVTALLRNVDGKEVSHDINSMVGVGGDYFIAVGDSITNGIGDEIPWNNDSLDGRIVSSQGFQARLADRLTATTRLPQILFNEGIGGDTAARMELRIDSILERHPSANKILLMIGTNDSGIRVAPDVFGNTVSRIVGKMNGRQVWLAKPMPTFIINSDWTLDGPRNSFIADYNVRINQIAQSNLNAFLGPNFYSRFSDRIDLYQDYLHPNDTGYVFMADRWHDVLVQ